MNTFKPEFRLFERENSIGLELFGKTLVLKSQPDKLILYSNDPGDDIHLTIPHNLRKPHVKLESKDDILSVANYYDPTDAALDWYEEMRRAGSITPLEHLESGGLMRVNPEWIQNNLQNRGIEVSNREFALDFSEMMKTIRRSPEEIYDNMFDSVGVDTAVDLSEPVFRHPREHADGSQVLFVGDAAIEIPTSNTINFRAIRLIDVMAYFLNNLNWEIQ